MGRGTHSEDTVGIPQRRDADFSDMFDIEIPEADGAGILDVKDVCGLLVAVAPVLRDSGRAVRTGHKLRDTFGWLAFVQVARNIGRILTGAIERPAVQTAGGHFHLRNAAVGKDIDGFGTSLAAVPGRVGVAVIEDVPLATDLHDTAVVVAAVGHQVLRIRRRVGTQVAVADNHAAVLEPTGGTVADGIAELVHHGGGIDKVILAIDFADGGCLKERVFFKARASGVHASRHNERGFLHDGQHILVQHRDHRAVSGLIPIPGKPRVQIGRIAFGQYAGVKLRLVACFLA